MNPLLRPNFLCKPAPSQKGAGQVLAVASASTTGTTAPVNVPALIATLRPKCVPMPPGHLVLVALVGDEDDQTAPWAVSCPKGRHLALACGVGTEVTVSFVSGSPGSTALPESVRKAMESGATVVAADAAVVQHWWRVAGWPEPSAWVDLGLVLRLANRSDDMAVTLLSEAVITKDEVGMIHKACIEPMPEDQNLAKMAMTQRARLRFLLMETLIGRFGIDLGRERVIYEAHQAINLAGVPVDLELARCAKEMLAALVDMVIGGLNGKTSVGVYDLKKLDRLLPALASLGVQVDDAKAETLEEALDELSSASEKLEKALQEPGLAPEAQDEMRRKLTTNAKARMVIVARLMVAKEGSFGHFAALIDAVSPDGMLRGCYTMAGHRLRRWTSRHGRAHQLRKSKLTVDEIRRVMDRVLARDLHGLLLLFPNGTGLPDVVAAATGVAGLIRMCFAAPEGQVWAVADISSFEPCGLLCLAGLDDEVAKLFAGRGVYMDGLAAAMKTAGKTMPVSGVNAEEDDKLYGMAKVGFIGPMFSARGEAVEKFARGCGVDLEAYGLTGDAIVAGFRQRQPGIVAFWDQLINAAVSALDGEGSTVAGRVRFEVCSKDLVAVLPSGGRLVYPNARKALNQWRNGWVIVYTTFEDSKVTEDSAWGGKLCQNVVSAMCRDIFAQALVSISGLISPGLLHTHDEVAILVPAAPEAAAGQRLAELMGYLTDTTTLAPGMILKAKGYLTSRYHKKPL